MIYFSGIGQIYAITENFRNINIYLHILVSIKIEFFILCYFLDKNRHNIA